VITDDSHLGLFSHDASASVVQSLLCPLYSDRHDVSAAAFAQAASSSWGRPPLPSLLDGIARAPLSEALLQHYQYSREQALCRVQHHRQIIANGRASTIGLSTSVNESPVLAYHISPDRHSPYGVGGREGGSLARLAGTKTTSMDAIPMNLPVIFAQPMDSLVLTEHQALLRQQIELFQTTNEDLSSRIRGRKKRIELGQVGIRCRHCAHALAERHTKGFVYFPATLLGLYQAAQNMSSNHIQCGLCPEMPDSLKEKFTELFPTKIQTSGGGRVYWAESAKRLGMIDTDHGIRFVRDM
jgi:hypothetical protein